MARKVHFLAGFLLLAMAIAEPTSQTGRIPDLAASHVLSGCNQNGCPCKDLVSSVLCERYRAWGGCAKKGWKCRKTCNVCDQCVDYLPTLICQKTRALGLCFKAGHKCQATCEFCGKPTPQPTPAPTPAPTPQPTPAPTPAPTPQPTPRPVKPVDVCIATDVSTTLGAKGWSASQFFLKKVIKSIIKVFPTGIRVRFAGVIFGSKIYDEFSLTANEDAASVAITSFQYIAGGSVIDKALKKCGEKFDLSDTKKIVLLLTDGNLTDMSGASLSFSRVKKQVNILKKAGVKVFTIGVGDDGNEGKLKKISGDENENESYHPVEKYRSNKSFENYAKKFTKF